MNQWTRFEKSVQRHLVQVPAETFDYSINISLKHRYAFVETPKVCCSTIKLNLQRLETGLFDFTWPGEMDIHNRDFSPLLKPSQVHDFDKVLAAENLYTFCFVRNPYTRLLSCYLDKIVGNKPPKHAVLRILGFSADNLDIPVSFSDFIEAISSQHIREMNPHWRPQYYQTFQPSLSYDFIGRYESFSEDFQRVMAKIARTRVPNLGVESRHRTNANGTWTKYYRPSLMERVRELFAIDFEAFGYDSSDKYDK